MSPEIRLQRVGIALPHVAMPAADYLACVRHGDVIYVSGQTPRTGSGMQHAGTVGRNVSEEQACEAAEICVARTLAVARAGLGDLGRIARVIRLGVFVRCTPDYLWTSRIADAASKVMHQAFGDAGRHARSTVGVAALPGGACVEIEAVFGLYAAVHSASQGK